MNPPNRLTLTKLCAAAALALSQKLAVAAGVPPDFSVTIGSGLLCRDVLDMAFFQTYLTANFGPPYKREQGAYWFKASAQLFGKSVKEVFIADGSTSWTFVGAVFTAKPEELAQSVQSIAGPVYFKAEPGNQYSPLLAQGSSEIMWQGEDAKLLCRRLIGP